MPETIRVGRSKFIANSCSFGVPLSVILELLWGLQTSDRHSHVKRAKALSKRLHLLPSQGAPLVKIRRHDVTAFDESSERSLSSQPGYKFSNCSKLIAKLLYSD
jgi:hypothetical protein